jgi:hypothetical protein
MQKGVTMEEMAFAFGMSVETQDGTKKGQQARLSQYENRPDGPPLDIVKQYVNYFALEGRECFDFFIEALNSSKTITIDMGNIIGIPKDVFIRSLTGVLAFKRLESKSTSWEAKAFALVDLIKEVYPNSFIRKYQS